MDTVDKITRSKMMASVKSKNTKLEIEIRHRLFNLGYRYVLHKRTLPGKPDIVLPKYHVVIFINGCFWHQHGCRFSKMPSTRQKWWEHKLKLNRQRDTKILSVLQHMTWRTIIIWECSVRASTEDRNVIINRIAKQIESFLISNKRRAVISGPLTRMTY